MEAIIQLPEYRQDIHISSAKTWQTSATESRRNTSSSDENPAALKKVIGVEGDISEKKLGLSVSSEEKLCREVQIVYHIAAMLKLDAELKDAVVMNVEGTLQLLNLATKMEKLVAFVHTSTAYCHCDIPLMEEKVYPTEESPYDVINMVHWMKPEILESITKKMIKPHPNTYTYTKRLAEKIVSDFHPRLPVTIGRPSIVIPAWEEPIPGWVDNLNGPTGLMIAAGKGVIRTMLADPEYLADLNPVDVVCNGLIAASWKTATDTLRTKEIPVYNLTQAEIEPVKWGDVLDLGREVIADYPFEIVLWYPGGGFHKNELQHNILALLFHWIPAYFIDFLMFLLGRKRFMVNAQLRIYHGQKLLQYFTTREWRFAKDNLLKLRDSLSPVDKKTYKLTGKNLDRLKYMINATLVTRHYLVKDDPNSIAKCKTKMKILYVIDRLTRVVFFIFIAWMILKVFNLVFQINNDKPVRI
ncbi:putative fatty acyl-CoA reductase CG5065 isoform X2 [Planococcus citri]|uniref:putative fatty acyl-CoA reductase CG5065 isoform X2 n=1 Tax=Planococcus citri TaxID=170843 RepID=UPI0031F85B13